MFLDRALHIQGGNKSGNTSLPVKYLGETSRRAEVGSVMASRRLLKWFCAAAVCALVLDYFTGRYYVFDTAETTYDSLFGQPVDLDHLTFNSTRAKAVHVMGPRRASHATVVSIYFAFAKSKHPPESYARWAASFMASVSGAPLVMYVDERSYAMLRPMRTARSTMRTVFVVYESIWDILRELEEERARNYTLNYREHQRTLDAERHAPELYAVWNLKNFYTHKVCVQNPYRSRFFIYSDAGAWRGKVVQRWPDPSFTAELSAVLGDRVLLAQVQPKNRLQPGWRDSIEGGFFAGSLAALDDFQRVFYNMHDKMFDAGLFIGT